MRKALQAEQGKADMESKVLLWFSCTGVSCSLLLQTLSFTCQSKGFDTNIIGKGAFQMVHHIRCMAAMEARRLVGSLDGANSPDKPLSLYI